MAKQLVVPIARIRTECLVTKPIERSAKSRMSNLRSGFPYRQPNASAFAIEAPGFLSREVLHKYFYSLELM